MPTLKFRNFLSASRKANMIPFGMYRSEAAADLDVIEAYGLAPVLLGITGAQDGSNTIFTVSGSLGSLYLNGLRQALTSDYTVSGTTITFVEAPAATDTILAFNGN